MKSYLIITPYFPFPITGGGYAALFNEIDGLRMKHNITYISPEPDATSLQELSKIWPNVDFRLYKQSFNHVRESLFFKIRKFYKLLFKNKKVDIPYYYDIRFIEQYFNTLTNVESGFINFVSSVLSEKQYDVIQVEFLNYLNLIHVLPLDTEKIFIHHEIGFVKMARNLSLIQEHKQYLQSLYNNYKTFEIALLNKYDSIGVLSSNDKNVLKSNGVLAPVFTNPVQVQQILDYTNDFVFNNTITFLGGEMNFPNAEGLNWFLNEIWPSVILEYPFLFLQIIGNWTIKTQSRYTHYKNVVFLGYVDSIDSQIKNSIMIVPIRIGSGVRIKIIEAIQNGVPVMSTQIGAEGLGLVHNESFFEFSNAEDLMISLSKIIQLKNMDVNEIISHSKMRLKEYVTDSLQE